MNADEESGGQTPTADPAPSARPPRWWRSLKGAFVLVLINGLILIFAVPSLRGGASRLGTKIAAAFLPQESTEEGWWYVCPMHLFYRKKQPGECGICGMTLVKKQAAELAVGAGTTISLSTRHVQLAGITSVEVDRRKLTRAVRTTGRIAYDERQIKYATAWLAGRIEEVHVDFTGVRVAAGDPLVELYSPDAIQSQAEYLNARRTLAAMRERRATDDEQVFQRRLVESSRTRLLRWGITEAQLEGLEREGAVADRITIYAPIAGTVVEKDAFAGRYVKAGSNLYQIVPLDPVWLYADIYEYEIPFVAVGQQVRAAVRAFPDHTFRGTVSFIDPFLQERTRTARVRCVFPNPDQRLKPGMYAEATIEVDLGEKLVVPTSAVVRSGDLDYVFVDAGAGQFDVRAVEIGPMVKDLYPVRQGLSSGERVVLTGAFLLSSESQLRGALSKLEAGTEFTLPGLGPEEHAIAGRGSAGNPRCAWDGMAMPADTFLAALETDGDTLRFCTKAELELYQASPDQAYVRVLARYRAELGAALAPYLAIRDALANDSIEGLREHALEFAIHAEKARRLVPETVFDPDPRDDLVGRAARLADAARALSDAADLEATRAQFAPLSGALVAHLRAVGSDREAGLTAFHCPMAKAVWVQAEGTDMGNPYYGTAMKQCGSPISLKR